MAKAKKHNQRAKKVKARKVSMQSRPTAQSNRYKQMWASHMFGADAILDIDAGTTFLKSASGAWERVDLFNC